MKTSNSFTVRFPGRVTTLVTHVVVMPAFDPTCDTPPTKQVKLNAIWDTGASGTCITEQVAEELGLSHFRVVTTHTANGDRESKVYKVNLMLPNNAGFAMVNATECAQLTGNCDVLVGMDIIGMGDFAITEADENTIMSFRFPHVEAIDYTGKGLPKKAIPIYNAKVGRNDPCPCGSGLKYKKCHGKKS